MPSPVIRSANAATVDDPVYGQLDTGALPTGVYTVPVQLMRASNVLTSSMAASAIDGTDVLEVDGTYALVLTLGTASMGTITGTVDDLAYYPSFSIDDGVLHTSGSPIKLAIEDSTATLPLVDPTNDYAAIRLYSEAMGGWQPAVLYIDWSSLQVQSISIDTSALEEAISLAQERIDAGNGTDELEQALADAQEVLANEGALQDDIDAATAALNAALERTVVDTSALKSAITQAKTSLSSHAKSEEATSALQTAIEGAQALLEDTTATQEQVDAAIQVLQDAVADYEASEDVQEATDDTQEIVVPISDTSSSGSTTGSSGTSSQSSSSSDYQVGHVYSVPLAFAKSGTNEVSMADQYFGDYALVRPLSDGTFDVRFSTNRPDYISSLIVNGQTAKVVSETSDSREYRIVLPSATTNSVYEATMTIVPMNGLEVSADLHLYYAQASDQGSDEGQESSSVSSQTASSSDAAIDAADADTDALLDDANNPSGGASSSSALAASEESASSAEDAEEDQLSGTGTSGSEDPFFYISLISLIALALVIYGTVLYRKRLRKELEYADASWGRYQALHAIQES